MSAGSDGWLEGTDGPVLLYMPDRDGWLEFYDPDGGDPEVAYPTGVYGVTSDQERALRFSTASAALAFWHQPSTRTPLRPDGAPNCPLAALTVVVHKVGTVPVGAPGSTVH